MRKKLSVLLGLLLVMCIISAEFIAHDVARPPIPVQREVLNFDADQRQPAIPQDRLHEVLPFLNSAKKFPRYEVNDTGSGRQMFRRTDHYKKDVDFCEGWH